MQGVGSTVTQLVVQCSGTSVQKFYMQLTIQWNNAGDFGQDYLDTTMQTHNSDKITMYILLTYKIVYWKTGHIVSEQ